MKKQVTKAPVKIDLNLELEKLLNQKDAILVKIDNLNQKIAQEAYDSVVAKLNAFIKSLNKNELDQLYGTGLIDEIINNLKNVDKFID